MRLNSEDVLDDAIGLLEDHSWQTVVPCLDRGHVAELVAVLSPLFQRSRPTVQARKRERAKQKLPSRPVRVKSSEVPDDIRDAVLARDGHCCVRCGIAVQRTFYSLHHRRPRGMGGSRLLHTMANLVTLCGSGLHGDRCHGEIENDRDGSTRVGWLVPHGVRPEDWPIEVAPRKWMQPGETWTPAKPHLRQREEVA